MNTERLRRKIDNVLDKVLPRESGDYIDKLQECSGILGDTTIFMARHEVEQSLIDWGLQKGQRAAVTNALTRFPNSTNTTVDDFRNMSEEDRARILSDDNAISSRRLGILDRLFR